MHLVSSFMIASKPAFASAPTPRPLPSKLPKDLGRFVRLLEDQSENLTNQTSLPKRCERQCRRLRILSSYLDFGSRTLQPYALSIDPSSMRTLNRVLLKVW